MQEIALYRKYRPGDFSEVVGQDHIVQVLEGALAEDKVAHAYLFAGPRGTGKTSVARILADKLGASRNDTYEMDAASNRGIDEIREIREAVRTLPMESPVKVYIIDEVHMLTKEAFNALLKTLEEPPAHVIFILATTEMHKLPATIISRCQTFSFKKPTVAQVKELVRRVVKKEKYTIEDGALETIAFLGDGSHRDAIGILQKVVSSTGDKEITADEVEIVTGAPSQWYIFNFILSILDKDKAGSLSVIKKAVDENKDMRVFIKMVMNQIRRVLFVKFSPELKKDIYENISEEEKKFIEDVSKREEIKKLPALLKKLLDAYAEVSYAVIPELPLELVVLDILNEE